jgi:hypothetical protein
MATDNAILLAHRACEVRNEETLSFSETLEI